jgi:hypothetical protein
MFRSLPQEAFMCDEYREAVDTITIAGLLKAVQVLHARAIISPEASPRSIEDEVLVAIKQIDADEFDYDIQAEGLKEALQLVLSVFRYTHSRREIGVGEAPFPVR